MGAGPLALLDAGLVSTLERAGAAVRTVTVDVDEHYPAELERGFAVHRAIADAAHESRAAGATPVVLSGNCNAGVIGCLAARGRGGPGRLGLVWFDAHGDFQTPDTDPDGFLDSMGLAMAVGRCWHATLGQLDGFSPLDPAGVLLAGTRDFDPGEREALEHAGVAVVPGGETPDLSDAIAPALDRIARYTDAVHLHLDADAHDARFGCANEWAQEGGPDDEGYLAAVRAVVRGCAVTSVSLASYDPSCDAQGRIGRSCMALLTACV